MLGLALLAAGCDGRKIASGQDRQAVIFDGQEALALDGRVADAAHLLTDVERRGLEARLVDFEKRTKHQMIVVTVHSLEGRDIADYTRDLGRYWGIGRKGIDDGIVILVAPTERKTRIAVGYGLENSLTSAFCQNVITEKMLPSFKTSRFAEGLDAGIAAINAKL